MTHQQIYERLKTEHAAALLKHGKWKDLEDGKQRKAILDELKEWEDAWFINDVHGPHGEIEELIDLINVAFRRIMYLTGEDQ